MWLAVNVDFLWKTGSSSRYNGVILIWRSQTWWELDKFLKIRWRWWDRLYFVWDSNQQSIAYDVCSRASHRGQRELGGFHFWAACWHKQKKHCWPGELLDELCISVQRFYFNLHVSSHKVTRALSFYGFRWTLITSILPAMMRWTLKMVASTRTLHFNK